MVSPQRGTAEAAVNGAAVSPVTSTEASGNGRNESQSGLRGDQGARTGAK